MKFISKRLDEIKEEDRQLLQQDTADEAPVKVDFLTYLVHSGKMDLNAITANVIDLMTAGVDTVSFSSSFCQPSFFFYIFYFFHITILQLHDIPSTRHPTHLCGVFIFWQLTQKLKISYAVKSKKWWVTVNS